MKHLKLLQFRNSNGDTLIEVIIATVIVGVVLFSAYNLSSRAVQLGQSAKERSQAAQLLQEQAEGLRSLRDNATNWAAFRAQVQPVVNSFHLVRSGSQWQVVNGSFKPGDLDTNIANYFTVEVRGQFSGPDPADPDKFTANILVDWARFGGGPAENTTAIVKLTDDNIPLTITNTSPPPDPDPDKTYNIEITADNILFDFYVNNQAVSLSGDVGNWTKIKYGEITLNSPPNRIAVSGKNQLEGSPCREFSCNPAMFIWTIYEADTGAVVASSGGSGTYRALTGPEETSTPSGWPNPDTTGWSSNVLTQPQNGSQPWSWALENDHPEFAPPQVRFYDPNARYLWPFDGVFGNGAYGRNKAYVIWTSS